MNSSRRGSQNRLMTPGLLVWEHPQGNQRIAEDQAAIISQCHDDRWDLEPVCSPREGQEQKHPDLTQITPNWQRNLELTEKLFNCLRNHWTYFCMWLWTSYLLHGVCSWNDPLLLSISRVQAHQGMLAKLGAKAGRGLLAWGPASSWDESQVVLLQGIWRSSVSHATKFYLQE